MLLETFTPVNEITEAQSLMMPMMMTMMIPWLLWLPITRDPNGVFSIVTSFIPPINTFVMMLRMGSVAPPHSVAGVAFHPGWDRGGLRLPVGRGQGLQSRPAHVRQAAESAHAVAVDPSGVN